MATSIDVNQVIQPLTHSRIQLCKSLPSTVSTIASLAIALLSILPIQVLKLVGFIISPLTPAVQCVANKLHAILITHAFLNLIASKSSLCFIKNIATKTVVWNGEDTKLAKKIIEENNLQIDSSFKIQGAKSDGICNGASLVLIKEVLSSELKEESDLVKLISKYSNGFPAEAAALQILSAGLLFSEKKKFLKEIDQSNESEEKIKDIRNRWATNDANRLKTLGSCIGLQKQNKQIDLEHVEANCYQLEFIIPGGLHSVIYLNLSFGSYVVDPSLGLFKLEQGSHKENLEKFYNEHYGNKSDLEKSLKLSTYILDSPQVEIKYL